MGLGYFRQMRPQGRLTPRFRAVHALFAALALILFPTDAFAQAVGEYDSDAGRAQVALLASGSVANTRDMNFGQIAQSNSAGTVTLSPAYSATCTVTGGLIRTGQCTSAEFSIRGRRNNRVRIREINGGQITLNRAGGGGTMSVTNLTIGVSGMSSTNGANGWNFGNWRIDANNGITEFWLGGRLNVNAAQPAGVYTGVVMIQIQFN
jgi:hypothetical protein